MNTVGKKALVPQDRRPWEPPTLKMVGKIAEVVQQGKQSQFQGDPGEPLKVAGA